MFNPVILRVNICLLLCFLLTVPIYSKTYEKPTLNRHKSTNLSSYPQNKVDRAILEYRQGRIDNNIKDNTKSCPLQFNVCKNSVGFSGGLTLPDAGDIFITEDRDALYIGPGPDTFFVTSDYEQVGDIIIYGEGVLLVDNAMLTLSGQLYAQNRGRAIFRNNAHLHFNQLYVGEYYVWLVDSAMFEAVDATVDANNVMHYVQLHDDCTYIARNTAFPDWTFRKIFNRSRLILEDVHHVGDIMTADSCFIHLTRCDTLMPWLACPESSVIEIEFPEPDYVEHFEFSESVPGIDGIDHTFIADSCRQCWWSLETWPSCSVTVNNSVIRGSAVRIPGSDTFSIYGLANYNFHPDLLVPLSDRHLEFVNTYVFWWNWYPYDQTVFNLDSCVFGEMIGRGGSEINAVNCIHDGATIMLASSDSAFVSLVDGMCQAFLSTWGKSTLLLVNTSVVPLWPYQSTNLAHGHSYLLAVNCNFEYEPEAMDTALVIFTAIDSLSDDTVGVSIDIIGSAWIDAGTYNTTTFDRYKLYCSHADDTLWTLIDESTSQIYNDSIALWNTSGLSDGNYDLRLTIWNSVGDSLTAFRAITLLPAGFYDYLPGDANMYNGIWPPSVIGGDVTYLVNFFRGITASHPCLLNSFWASADANGDCIVLGSDVIRLVNYFRGSGVVEYCADYEPSWPTPDDLPDEAPEGWPGCE